MLGGPRAVTGPGAPAWPVTTPEDEEAVLGVIRSGHLTSMSRGGSEVQALEREWAAYVGVDDCVGVSNGTAALTLALAAVGVGPGDEVLVPALGFIATAVAPLREGATPVFVDVDPVTFNIDPAAAVQHISPRTRALLVVHLHGLPADMAALRALALAHDLSVVEDAAQAHGATWRGRRAGSLGDIGTFSLNPTKNLASCGEGGLVTTDRSELGDAVRRRRQFGESLDDGRQRRYVSEVVGWNEKMSPVQAAYTRSQLRRFDAAAAARDANVRRFHDRIGGLPGVTVPSVPQDATHAWHILRYRFDPAPLGYDDVPPPAFRRAVQRALVAEGVPLTHYQLLPLPAQPAFALDRNGSNGSGSSEYPQAAAVIEETATLQKVHLAPEARPALDTYADAFEKVWENAAHVVKYARQVPYVPPWAAI